MHSTYIKSLLSQLSKQELTYLCQYFGKPYHIQDIITMSIKTNT